MVEKSFPGEQVGTENYEQNFFVENFLWLQNYFPGNKLELKIFINNFLSKIFYGCKIISCKQVGTENFRQKFFGRKFFMVAKSFPVNRLELKIFVKNFFGRNFLWLQNHYLGNRLELKIFIKNFWSKIFYGCKIISWGIGWN